MVGLYPPFNLTIWPAVIYKTRIHESNERLLYWPEYILWLNLYFGPTRKPSPPRLKFCNIGFVTIETCPELRVHA